MNAAIYETVFKRLRDRGWVTRTALKEISENSIELTVEWTPLGVLKMLALHALLGELGYQEGFVVGEFEALCALSRECARKHNLGNSGSSGSAPRR